MQDSASREIVVTDAAGPCDRGDALYEHEQDTGDVQSVAGDVRLSQTQIPVRGRGARGLEQDGQAPPIRRAGVLGATYRAEAGYAQCGGEFLSIDGPISKWHLQASRYALF